MQLQDMEHIKAHIHDNTIMVCTMNGLKHERLIQHYVDESRIVRGVTMDCRIRISWTYTFNGAGPVEIVHLYLKVKLMLMSCMNC